MSDTIPFFVSQFNKRSISLLIKECFGAQFPDISQKRQVQYLINYLQKLGAVTVLCETHYIDKDFLNDHQKYYVTCFNNYSTRCARLHFFTEKFSHDDIVNWIEKNAISEIDSLKNSYLGFSVIKPLPVTFLGRTCLKHYENNKERNYLKKIHTANLFGIDLEVESIAFQEQDKVVAACATTALWSLMHATKHLYYKSVPSPSEITLNAIGSEPFNINGFPNDGLSDEQILKALESFKLKLHDLKINTETGLSLEQINQYIMDHLNSGTPILAGVTVFKKVEESYVYKGDHAITILGSNSQNGELKALYIHDDRIGPYVKATLTKKGFKSNREETSRLGFHYKLKVDGHDTEEVITLDNIKTCNYHKVRIPYILINSCCLSLKEAIQEAFSELAPETGVEISYEIRLCQSKDLKKLFLSKSSIKNKTGVLSNNWPNYVWSCSFFYKDEQENSTHIMDLIYDTTDIPLGNELLSVVEHHQLTPVIIDLLNKTYISLNEPYRSPEKIEKSFFYSTLRSLSSNSDSYFEKVDNIYGPLRPPTRLDDDEIIGSDIKQTPSQDYIFTSQNQTTLADLFTNAGVDKLIWLISSYGSLHVGEDFGHPTLINAAPARIAGEIYKQHDGKYKINGKSGRYSKNYTDDKRDEYLSNALLKFKSLFLTDEFILELYDEATDMTKIVTLE